MFKVKGVITRVGYLNASNNGRPGFFALIPDRSQQNQSFLTWIEKEKGQQRERERAKYKMTTSDIPAQSLVLIVWFEPAFIRIKEFDKTLYLSVSRGTGAIVMSPFLNMVKIILWTYSWI